MHSSPSGQSTCTLPAEAGCQRRARGEEAREEEEEKEEREGSGWEGSARWGRPVSGSRLPGEAAETARRRRGSVRARRCPTRFGRRVRARLGGVPRRPLPHSLARSLARPPCLASTHRHTPHVSSSCRWAARTHLHFLNEPLDGCQRRGPRSGGREPGRGGRGAGCSERPPGREAAAAATLRARQLGREEGRPGTHRPGAARRGLGGPCRPGALAPFHGSGVKQFARGQEDMSGTGYSPSLKPQRTGPDADPDLCFFRGEDVDMDAESGFFATSSQPQGRHCKSQGSVPSGPDERRPSAACQQHTDYTTL
ncbi:PREDICTED: uncharacterized protein LOC105584308 [Cercocebus atys]|uniref:uncharacterized protein LOC105584308 n=1 Tax=Cercocebus atys TaxID=9531 RepID=UPI0005F42F9E|nr:PREDICTED: uncharacterized protein LOC105584308 [Cercocebus atys]